MIFLDMKLFGDLMREPYPSGLYLGLGLCGIAESGRWLFGGEPPALRLLSCGGILHMGATSCYTKS
jgi:hypothetical protein